jgi:hypothetical protein
MPRPVKAYETQECLRVELPYLLSKKLLVKGASTAATLNWNANGQQTGSASLLCNWRGLGENFVTLSYTVTRQDGSKRSYSTKITLDCQPSNLGKGEILYMLCPKTGRKCRILYKAYGSEEFMSRAAYKVIYGKRIYYETQTDSKHDRENTRYWRLEKKLNKDREKRKAFYYNGRPTKRMLWREDMTSRLGLADERRWAFFEAWAARIATK